jgi:hypothetical protein
MESFTRAVIPLVLAALLDLLCGCSSRFRCDPFGGRENLLKERERILAGQELYRQKLSEQAQDAPRHTDPEDRALQQSNARLAEINNRLAQ